MPIEYVSNHYTTDNHRTTDIIGHSIVQRNTRRYCKTVVEVHGAWCTENDARTLLPVDARIGKTTVNREQCVGVIFCTPGTVYLHYSLAVSQSVYAVFSLCLNVQLYLSSGDHQCTLHGLINNVFLSQQSRMQTLSPNWNL